MKYSQRVDHPHANRLVYSDIQKWIKRIRRRLIPGTNERYRLRYMVAGEYGAMKGRAHWHALLYWQSQPPEYSKDERWSDDPFWSEGFTNWQEANGKCVAYVAKYVSKSNVDPATETCFHGSFRPLIGGAFFRQWAELHVEQGLPLNQGRKYQIAGSRTKKDKPFDYWMTEAAARLVVRRYVEAWAEKYGTHPPYSRIVEKYCDDEAKARLERLRDEAAIERVKVGGRLSPRRKAAAKPSHGPPLGYESWWDEHVMAFVAVTGDGRPELFWNDKAAMWSRRVHPRVAGLADMAAPLVAGNDPVPDLPGEAPREYRCAADVPEHVPGEPLDLLKRRKAPGARQRYAAQKAAEYHRQMMPARMARVADAIKRLRDEAE